MIMPGRTLLWCLVLLAAGGVVLTALYLPWTGLRVWESLALAVILVAAVDLFRAWRRPPPGATRTLPDAFALQRPSPVEIILDPGPAETLLLADHHPGDDPDTGMPVRVERKPEEGVRVHYQYRPRGRGRACFGPVELWRDSPLGLWSLRARVPAETEVPVYPDFASLLPERLRLGGRTRQAGQRLRPRAGEGQEFHQLREYRTGDRMRQIDWSATARRRSLISREYREEISQPLILLLDGSHRLAVPAGEISAFDHALNCSLLLAASALEAGDPPGLMLHSGSEELWVPPERNPQSLHRLLRNVYPLEPSEHASDFLLAARTLLQRQRRRATLVWITRLQPDDHQDLLAAARLLTRRHRLLVGDIQLPAQQALHNHVPEDLDGALEVTAEARYQQEQRALQLRLRQAGVPVTSATPADMGRSLNALYLSLRRDSRL